MSKDKLTDMSIDPSKIKGKKTEDSCGSETQIKGHKKVSTRKDPKFYISHHKGHGKARNSVCVKKGDVVQKVARKGVEKLFIAEGWAYCPRNLWKAQVRDAPSKA